MLGANKPNDFLDLLRKRGVLGEREIRQACAQELGMAFADLDRVRIAPEALTLIPAGLARELRVLPIKRHDKTLWLALDAPDLAAVQRVKEETGLRVIPVMCVSSALDAELAKLT